MPGKPRATRTQPRIAAADAAEIARLMQALASPVRVQILGELQQGPSSVGELAELLDLSQPALSNQLRLLRNLRLVATERHGRHVHYSLHDEHVAELLTQSLRHQRHD